MFSIRSIEAPIHYEDQNLKHLPALSTPVLEVPDNVVLETEHRNDIRLFCSSNCVQNCEIGGVCTFPFSPLSA